MEIIRYWYCSYKALSGKDGVGTCMTKTGNPHAEIVCRALVKDRFISNMIEISSEEYELITKEIRKTNKNGKY